MKKGIIFVAGLCLGYIVGNELDYTNLKKKFVKDKSEEDDDDWKDLDDLDDDLDDIFGDPIPNAPDVEVKVNFDPEKIIPEELKEKVAVAAEETVKSVEKVVEEYKKEAKENEEAE